MEKTFYASKTEEVKLIGIVQVQLVWNGKVYYNEYSEDMDTLRKNRSLPVDEFKERYGKIVGSTVYDPTDNADKAIESLADFLDAKLKYHRGDASDGDDSASDDSVSDSDEDDEKINAAGYLEGTYEYPKRSSLFQKEYFVSSSSDEEEEDNEDDEDDKDNDDANVYKSRYKKRKRKLKGGEVKELEMDVVNKLNF